MRKTLRVGSRGSELALAQTRRVLALLGAIAPELRVEIEIIRTQGDAFHDVPFRDLGDRGFFIKEIELALAEERIDFAVHSMKDVPTRLQTGLALAAATERIDPRDVLVSPRARSLHDLREGGFVATGSLRRRSQLLALRPDLNVVEIRGNVPTRLRKLEASEWDGIILASAGLARLGLSERASAIIPIEQMLPAVGQGALALEARRDDREVVELLSRVEHPPTARSVAAERAFLARLEGGCQVPIGALALVQDDALALEAYLGSPDGRSHVRRRREGHPREAEEIGIALAEEMLEQGGAEILAGLRESP